LWALVSTLPQTPKPPPNYEDYQGKIVFGKLDVDENKEKAMEYGIMSIPALLVFQNSELVDLIIGAQPRKTLEPKITKYL